MLKYIKLCLIISFLFVLEMTANAQAGTNPANILIWTEDSTKHAMGMGWVFEKDRVIVALHSIMSEYVLTNKDDEVMYYPTVYVAFPKVSIKKRLGHVIAVDAMRDLAYINVNTGNIKPREFAQKVTIGERVWWNLPGATSHARSHRISAIVLDKEEKFHFSEESSGTELHYHENVSPPAGQELILVVGYYTTPGSSGGIVTNRRGGVVGLVVMRNEGRKSRMVSVDGIRRSIAERQQSIFPIPSPK